MALVADLHIHTIASDGRLTPEEIVERAEGMGLQAVAITDHDSVDGVERAVLAAREIKLEVIPGIELSSEYREHEIHMLGYFIDINNAGLLHLLRKLQQSRHERAEEMVEKLSAMGYNIELDSVIRIAGRAAPGRPHIARALMEKGYVKNIAQAFNELIGFRGPAYAERFKLTPEQAIKAIRSAGGLPVWAHPGLTGYYDFIRVFCAYGLQGLEAYHPDHKPGQDRRLKTIAKKRFLCITGGSDFHGGHCYDERDLACCGMTEEELAAFRQCHKQPR